MQSKFIIFICFCWCLSGCEYESTQDLHSGMQEYKPTQFFKKGEHVFKLAGSNQYIALNVFSSMVAVRRIKLTDKLKPKAHYFYKLYHDGDMKVGDYIVYKPSGSGNNKKHIYFAFTFLGDDKGFIWIQSGAHSKVNSRKQLIDLISKNKHTNKAKTFKRVSVLEAQKVLDHITFLNNKKSNTNTHENKPLMDISAYDIGDAVYLKNEAHTGKVSIVRIDKAKNLIKIRRSDNTIAWLAPEQISIDLIAKKLYLVCLHNKSNLPVDIKYRRANNINWTSLTLDKQSKHLFKHPQDLKLYVKYDEDLSSAFQEKEYYLLSKMSLINQTKMRCEHGMHYDFKSRDNKLIMVKAKQLN